MQGQYQERVAQPFCLPCIPGKIQSDAGVALCSDCSAGQFRASKNKDGTSTDPTTCSHCIVGRFQPNDGQASCLPCIPGSHNENTGAIVCRNCLPGTFMENSESDAVSCKDCPSGFSNNVNQSTNCLSNPQGSYMVPASEGGANFVLCDRGYYCSGGANKKIACIPGSVSANEGSVICLKCTPGQYAKEYGTVNCISCPSMHFASRENQTSCKPCELGKKTEDGLTGATSCQSCGAGEFGAVCAGCPAGMFRSGSDSDATICKHCPSGYHQGMKSWVFIVVCLLVCLLVIDF